MLTQTHHQSDAMLAALDIDGTVTREGSIQVPSRTITTVAAVRAEGHDVVLASGRSLAGILPVAERLKLTEAFVVASSGAVTALLDPRMPGGYEVVSAEMFDAGPIIELVCARQPGARIAIEEVGWGYFVTDRFPDGAINGNQMRLPLTDLMAARTPRLILRAPGVAAELLEHLWELGVTARASSPDSIDVTPNGVSKATALEPVRAKLGVSRARVVVVGDGQIDLPMFEWARAGGGRAVAMGHAPQAVRAAAGEVTGTLEENGAAAVLDSILTAESTLAVVAR
ncbi:HAD family hydrolase [Myceligenerans halotolerans]